MRLLVTGGGTGGHIYPAIAVARAVLESEPGADVLYVGTVNGLEADIVPKEGLPFRTIPSRGMVGGGLIRAPGTVWVAARGVLAALRVIRWFDPDVALGTGGYVAGPVSLAAALRRVPLVLHEQNAFPGVTNRVAARWAAAVAVPYAEARRYFPSRTRVVVTGNPIRRSVVELTSEEGRRILGLPAGKAEPRFVVYLVGGSRGAEALNDAAVRALPGLMDIPGIHAIFATGSRYYASAAEALASQGIGLEPGGKITLVPYLERADAAIAVADVVVTRAGGTTLAEITARGVPAVIVPSPNVTHNHQVYNARVLEKAGAARVILEQDLSGPVLEAAVRELWQDEALRKNMSRASLRLGRPEAADDIAGLVMQAARRRPRGSRRGRGPVARRGLTATRKTK
ncbi:MAG: undecaprenyldiphospho-muramoylpentapeptide beta-N-acetylglucosaminyltransferase [Bacillota bacterium]|nr:MAG: undecaprenyldiphospho-muramoylpentapeptide beta-N-acetylglucosaminyltransferase [Bacillota bacterium]